MTQSELNRAIARVTGESLSTIAHMGFVPLTSVPLEREPLVVDWDELDSQRVATCPNGHAGAKYPPDLFRPQSRRKEHSHWLRLPAVWHSLFGPSSAGPLAPAWVPLPSVWPVAPRGSGECKTRRRRRRVPRPRRFRHRDLWLPFPSGRLRGQENVPVQLESQGKGRVMVQWRDGSVPQLVQYEAVEPPEPRPFLSYRSFHGESLVALGGAARRPETADPDSIRYALGCGATPGSLRRIVATDGRQLLVQTGFTFPWEGEILVPRTRSLPRRASPGSAGRGRKTDDWVVFRSGPWTLWLAINKDGRFPNVESHLPAGHGHRPLPPVEGRRQLLAQTLPRLPGDEELNVRDRGTQRPRPVRAKAPDQPRPTEVVLRNSTWTGEAVRLNTNRRFLARAVRLGFEQVYCFGPRSPLACQDDRRTYVWALLEPEAAIKPAEDPIRIQSPEAGQAARTSNVILKRRSPPMTEPSASVSGSLKANGKAHKVTSPKLPSEDIASLIQETEAVRTALRDALGKTNELLTSLKRHRQRSRALQNTLESLRQLKSLGV